MNQNIDHETALLWSARIRRKLAEVDRRLADGNDSIEDAVDVLSELLCMQYEGWALMQQFTDQAKPTLFRTRGVQTNSASER